MAKTKSAAAPKKPAAKKSNKEREDYNGYVVGIAGRYMCVQPQHAADVIEADGIDNLEAKQLEVADDLQRAFVFEKEANAKKVLDLLQMDGEVLPVTVEHDELKKPWTYLD